MRFLARSFRIDSLAPLFGNYCNQRSGFTGMGVRFGQESASRWGLPIGTPVGITGYYPTGVETMRLLVIAFVWWVISGWAFSPDSRVIGGPFDTFAKCDAAGRQLPSQYYASGWHCDSE